MRWGMVIDLDMCTGCGACVVGCRQENNVPVADEQTFYDGRSLDWIQLADQTEGEYDTLRTSQYPLMCQQCDKPPCTKVCPVRATYRDEEGIVGQIYRRCIGCRYCTNACPYSVKTFNWFEPKWPEGSERRQNPDVSLRPVGVVEKCTFCHHRRQKAKEAARASGQEFKVSDYVPACVEVCPAKAMTFGDIDDPVGPFALSLQDRRAERLMENLGTEPKIVYLKQQGGRK